MNSKSKTKSKLKWKLAHKIENQLEIEVKLEIEMERQRSIWSQTIKLEAATERPDMNQHVVKIVIEKQTRDYSSNSSDKLQISNGGLFQMG